MRLPGRGRRTPRTTAQERLVAAAILASAGDARGERLYQQFARSILPIRDLTPGGLTVKPGGTTEDLLVPLDRDVSSAWVHSPDVATGQPLAFRVNLIRAGFFWSLEGRAEGGAWPQEWQVDPAAVRAAAVGALRLPAQRGGRCLEKLLAWLSVDAAPAGPVVCRPPAGKADVETLMAQEGATLPAGVPAFLGITDGLDIGELFVFGRGDLHLVDVEGQRQWLVALEDDRHFLMAPGPSPVLCLPTHDSRVDDMAEVGDSFPHWLRSRLTGGV